VTSTGFDAAWADATVRQLAATGVEFAAGLDQADIATIEAAFGAPVPPELALLLRSALPASEGWARWADGPERVADHTRRWINDAFAFDIRHGYWHRSFGQRPSDPESAITEALAVVERAPALFPIYGHRYLVSEPTDGPRAVLSVWQAFDSIVYGNDLADYLTREFRIERPTWAATEHPHVPIWEDLLHLPGTIEPAEQLPPFSTDGS
jgi:hypothetical protein